MEKDGLQVCARDFRMPRLSMVEANFGCLTCALNSLYCKQLSTD